jgi:hypothetical protein
MAEAELRNYTPPPSEWLGSKLQDLLMAAGMQPYNAGHLSRGVLGLAQATPLAVPLGAADLAFYKNQDNPMGAALAAVSMVPGAKAAKGAAKAIGAAKTEAASTGDVAAKALFPQVAERYPTTLPPVEAIDKTKGTPYLAKQLSEEAQGVQQARIAAQRDIDKGNYTPYFDPAQRFDVDPTKYPNVTATTEQVMKKPETRKKYDDITMGPETKTRLDEAYQRGMKQEGNAGNWYQMGQLENEFIKEYGPEQGRQMFKERFADSMAATTGGADPTSNLMMGHYGNYLKATGQPLPSASYDYPFPVGGRYAATNMEQFRKMLMESAGVTAANPKRYNFSANFLGNRSGATIDEQMMGLIQPGKANPPSGAYGHYEAPVAERAAAAGVDPRFYQEVAWAGAKDAKTNGGYTAKPMIGIVNEAIERTHRITGMPHEEIVRRGLVRSEIPLYGLGAVGLGSALSGAYDEPATNEGGM